jgi:hypothetical protein
VTDPAQPSVSPAEFKNFVSRILRIPKSEIDAAREKEIRAKRQARKGASK